MTTPILMARSPQERRRVLAFVRRQVRRLYGDGIPPSAQILLFAEQNRRICGTIALDFAESYGKFPLEAIYRIDYAQTPWPFDRTAIAQFGKWWKTRPGIAVHLMHAAHVHALSRGKRFGLCEVKPTVLNRVEELGMTLVEVPGAILQIQGVSARSEGYYVIPPPPQLYMFDIRANTVALARYIELQEGS